MATEIKFVITGNAKVIIAPQKKN